MMKIHAIQTGTVAIKQSQQSGKGIGMARRLNTLFDQTWTKPLPIWAWVIEHTEGVIVIDTGETSKTSEHGYFPRWHPYFRLGVRAFVQPNQEIGPALRTLGLSPSDVRWVVLTHLHTDHAGGLHYFRNAEILVSRREYSVARGFKGQLRGYLPHRWPTWFVPRQIDFNAEPIGPFSESFTLTRASDVVIVPTPGHTYGHLSVILRDWKDGIAVFFAGDTSYTEHLMVQNTVDGVAPNDEMARKTLMRISQFVSETPTIYLPSHDPDARNRLIYKQIVRV